MSADVSGIVDEVIAASPPIPDGIDALRQPQRTELDHLVKRSGITPEAALSVLRGRRQEQHAQLERKAATADVLAALGV